MKTLQTVENSPIQELILGEDYIIARFKDGHLEALGPNRSGKCELPDHWQSATTILPMMFGTVAVFPDGIIETTDPYLSIPEHWTEAVQVTATDYRVGALFADGHAEIIGQNTYGECDLPSDWPPLKTLLMTNTATLGVTREDTLVGLKLPPTRDEARVGITESEGLRSGTGFPYITQACILHLGYQHLVVEHENGDFETFGDLLPQWLGGFDITWVWPDVRSVWVGSHNTVVQLKDGTIKGSGTNLWGQLEFPHDWTDIEHVWVGPRFTLAQRANGELLAIGDSSGGALSFPDHWQPADIERTYRPPVMVDVKVQGDDGQTYTIQVPAGRDQLH